MSDKIAVVVPRFKLLASSDGPRGSRKLYRNEPYLVTLAVDAGGGEGPKISFNSAFYPNVRQGDTVSMLGHGHLCYGPKNPGEWVAVSILVMESDEDIRERGKMLNRLVPEVMGDSSIMGVLKMNPTVAVVAGVLSSVTGLIAKALVNNTDDLLLRTQGTFLRDVAVPYQVNRAVKKSNRWAEIDLAVVPLIASNGQGPTPRDIS